MIIGRGAGKGQGKSIGGNSTCARETPRSPPGEQWPRSDRPRGPSASPGSDRGSGGPGPSAAARAHACRRATSSGTAGRSRRSRGSDTGAGSPRPASPAIAPPKSSRLFTASACRKSAKRTTSQKSAEKRVRHQPLILLGAPGGREARPAFAPRVEIGASGSRATNPDRRAPGSLEDRSDHRLYRDVRGAGGHWRMENARAADRKRAGPGPDEGWGEFEWQGHFDC